MVNGLAGKVVCITGAAERAGREFALRYADAGAKVVINYLPSQADEAWELTDRLGSSATAVAADITDAGQCQALVASCVATFGRLDVLVHNASTFRSRNWSEVTEDEFDSSLGVNLRGPFFLTQAAAKVMLAKGGGNIIALVGNSLSEAWPTYIPHSVSKTALARLMEQMAVALAPKVACNSVAPSQFYRSDDGANDQLRESRGETLHSGGVAVLRPGLSIREADVDAVFEALVYFSTCTAQITGTTLRVDGGKSLA